MELICISKFLLFALLTSIPVYAEGKKAFKEPKMPRPFLCHPKPQTLEKLLTTTTASQSLEKNATTQFHNHKTGLSTESIQIWSSSTITESSTTKFNSSVSTEEYLSTVGDICEKGWDLWGLSCYYFAVNERGTFAEVEEICRQKGAYLASVASAEEQEYLRNISKQRVVIATNSSNHKRVWIGGTDLLKEGHWMWTDAEPLSFTYWGIGQPNNYKDQDCLVYSVETGDWEDVDCEVNWGYVCKKNLDDPTKCDKGWKRWSTDCYLFEFEKKVTWLEAHYSCREYGAYLLSLRILEEQDYIQGMMSYEDETNSIWTGGRNLSGMWSWSDGANFELLNDEKEHFFGASENDCLIFDPEAGIWKAENCFNHFGFICRKLRKDRRACEEGWEVWGEHCYLFEFNLMKSWEDAQETCERNGTFLVSVHSAAEEAFIKDLSQTQYQTVSIPASTAVTRTVWIGAKIGQDGQDKDQQSGKWLWTDGTMGLYSNIDDYDFTDNCISLDVYTGEWIASDCSMQTAFICKQDRQDMAKCSEGWIHWGNSCYAVQVKEKVTWFKAQEHCRHSNSHLSSVLSQEEFTFIQRMIGYKIPEQQPGEEALTWTGGNDLVNESHWRWTDGMSSSFSNYIFGGDSNDTDRDCLGIYQRLQSWNRLKCSSDLNYVCKTDDAFFQKCPEEWKVWGANCYWFNFDLKVSWQDAQVKCNAMGATLVSITSWEEQAFLESMTDFQQQSQNLAISKVWTGGNKHSNGQPWMWNYRGKMNFTNWNQGYPVDSNDLCVAMILTSGKWKSLQCSQQMDFVCKKTTLDVSQCPEGWEPWLDYCFLFRLEDELTWFDAKDYCLNRNGELLSILSSDENNLMKAILREKSETGPVTAHAVWIGASDLQKENNFKWTDGQTVDFTDWGDGQPNNWKEQDCVLLNIDSGWQDATCDNVAKFVCKLVPVAGEDP